MFNTIRTNYSVGIVTLLLVGMGLAMSLPTFASAATYAYVDANGEVRSVVAPDWRTAINTAPNIHVHSGVLLLNTAADFGIVGDNVPAF
jgi:hypothetical protein